MFTKPITLILLVIALASSPALAARKVVVVVANRVLLRDLENPALSTISKLLADGAVGLISPNCAGFKTEFSVLLTASSGASCRGAPYVGECYDVDEHMLNGELAGLAYMRRIGIRPRAGSAVFLGLPQAVRENRVLGEPAAICALGDALHRAGKRTCAIGNADTPPEIVNRAAAVLASDSKGRIDIGDLESRTTETYGPECQIPDHQPPLLGERTGEGVRLARRVTAALGRADFVVVSFGATTQLDDSRMSTADEAFAKQWETALRELDSLLAALVANQLGREVALVLVSFSPPAGPRWNELTPIIVYPSRFGGLLVSPGTRTPGLIAASDFPAAMLSLFNIWLGPPIYDLPASEQPSSDKIAALDALSERATATRTLELPMLWFFAAVGILSYTLAAVALGFRVIARSRKLIKIGILICGAAPLAMLLASLAPGGVAGYVLATALALVCIIVIAWRAGQKSLHRAAVEGRIALRAVPLITIFWLTSAAILIDSALGGTLCKFSVPSSYQISGLRFFGIGNEYAAVLISMAALAVLFSSKNRRSSLLLPAGLLTVIFLGASPLGANYGATFAAAVCFGLLWRGLQRGGFGGRDVIVWCVAALIVSAGFAFADWKLAGAAGSHAGRTEHAARFIGGSYWLDIAIRKLMLNFRLISSNTAEKAFLAFVPFLALWFGVLQGRVKRAFESDPSVIAGLKAVIIGAAVAFVANDSGIVMASIMIAMAAAVVLYAGLEEAAWEGS